MDRMRIKTCVLGPVSTNCYLIYDKDTKRAVIVDPADSGRYLLEQCRSLGLTVEAVLLTHGHFDHIMAVEDVRSALGCPVYIGAEEEMLLSEPMMNLSIGMGGCSFSTKADKTVKDGDELFLAGFSWKVIATPGHTAGSVSYYAEGEAVLFSGDTLFAESLGRTDLPTSSTAEIVRSIGKKLFELPGDVMVYPGHGDPTSIGREKVYNPVAVYSRRG